MFTVCPKCALTLVVTAADLRVAQGYVRCGRCSSVFNALARLTDDRQGSTAGPEAEAPPAVESTEAAIDPADEPADEPAAAGAPTQDTTPPADAEPAVDEEAIPDDALEFNPDTTDVGSVFVEPPPDPQWTAETGSFRAMRAASEPRQEESPQREVDVEIDAAFLASMLRAEEPGNVPGAAGRPQESPPTPAVPLEQPAAASNEPRPRAVPPREPAPRQPAQRRPLPREAGRELPQRAADPAAPASATPAAGDRPAARHLAHRNRPDRLAVSRPSPATQRTHTPQPPRPAATARDPEVAVAAPASAAPAASASEQPLLASFETDAAAGAAAAWSYPRSLWIIGTAVAALLLVIQIVNHYRDELAASARFNRPLTALYAALGVRLTPRWDLHAYDVRQLGASVDPAGAGMITVRASIKNAAQQAQPLPLLRVTLQDRFGTPLASSDVAPHSYLPRAVPASSFLAGGQRIDAEMGFVDPGANAVGFEIDACLPTSAGGVACANDAAPR
jgi:predicted Zn finger-like uncharacterized protein